MSRNRPITGIAAVNFFATAFLVVFLMTDFTNIVPADLKILLFALAIVHATFGVGLLKLRNWARIGTAILALFWAFPSIIEILVAFRLLDFVKLLVNLLLVTIYGCVVVYLVHPTTKTMFEEQPVELRLK